jgi:hypothetical protein
MTATTTISRVCILLVLMWCAGGLALAKNTLEEGGLTFGGRRLTRENLIGELMEHHARSSALLSGSCQDWTFSPTECTSYPAMQSPQNQPIKVFIPDNMTEIYASNQAEYWVQNVKTIFAGNPFTTGCVDPSFQILCATWLPPCIEVDGVALPVRPCTSIWRWVNSTCGVLAIEGKVWNEFGAGNYIPLGAWNHLPMLLNWTDPYTGSTFFQETGYNFTLPNGTNIFVECNAAGGFVTNITEGTCQSPLVQQGEDCYYECDLPALSEDDAYSMKVLYAVASLLGVIMCGSLLVLFALNPRLRILPSGLTVPVVFWGLVVELALAYPAITGYRYQQIWCEGHEFISTKYEQVYTSQGLLQYKYVDLQQFTSGGFECSWEGFMLYIGLLNMLFSSLHINAYQCFYILVAMIPKLDRVVESTPVLVGKLTINVAVELLGTFVIVGVASGLWGGGFFKMSVGSPYCFLDPSDIASTVATWIIPVFTWVVLVALTTVFMLVFLLHRTCKLGLGDLKGSKLMGASIVVFIKGFVVTVVYIGITFYAVYFENNYTSISNDFNNYEQCLINELSPICATHPSQGAYASAIMFSGAITVIAPLCIVGITFFFPRFWSDNHKFVKSCWACRKTCGQGFYDFWRGVGFVFLGSKSSEGSLSDTHTLDMTMSPPVDDDEEEESSSENGARDTSSEGSEDVELDGLQETDDTEDGSRIQKNSAERTFEESA